MKRIAILTALILAAVSAFGQAVRVDIPLQTAGPSVPISGGPLPQALWVANAAAYLCTHPSATLVACQAHPITTYTDSTGGTTCPTATPLVQLPGNTCTAATGTTANVGFWYGGGLFDYWIVSSYGAYGPFSGNSGGTSSGVSQILAGINVTISPTGGTGAVTINATGSGGSSVWGGITGTLSNQTDLQTALNAKANLTGAAFTGPVSAPSVTAGTTSDDGFTPPSIAEGTTSKILMSTVWDRNGPVASIGAGTCGFQGEMSVIKDTNSQLLGQSSSVSVFKATGTGLIGGVQDVCYAESLDGLTWTVQTTPLVTNHNRSGWFLYAGTYYLYTTNFGNGGGLSVDLYTSTVSNGTYAKVSGSASCGTDTTAILCVGTSGATITSAGSGQNAGTYTITGTGGGCSIEPQLQITIVSGAVTTAQAWSAGAGCSTLPAFTVAAGGTPGTVVSTGLSGGGILMSATDSADFGSPRVIVDGSTWRMLYEANGLPTSTYIYGTDFLLHAASSSDGIHWTKYAGNPVVGIINIQSAGSPWFFKDPLWTSGPGPYWLWAHITYPGQGVGDLPADIARYSSPDAVTWTQNPANTLTYPRLEWWEGAHDLAGGLANPALVESNGSVYLYTNYFEHQTQNWEPGQAGIEVAVASMTLHQLVSTDEGATLSYAGLPNINQERNNWWMQLKVNGSNLLSSPNCAVFQYANSVPGSFLPNDQSSSIAAQCNLYYSPAGLNWGMQMGGTSIAGPGGAALFNLAGTQSSLINTNAGFTPLLGFRATALGNYAGMNFVGLYSNSSYFGKDATTDKIILATTPTTGSPLIMSSFDPSNGKGYADQLTVSTNPANIGGALFNLFSTQTSLGSGTGATNDQLIYGGPGIYEGITAASGTYTDNLYFGKDATSDDFIISTTSTATPTEMFRAVSRGGIKAPSITDTGLGGTTQCLESVAGVLTGTGAACGSGAVTTSGSPVSPNVACFSASTAIGPCTSANVQTAIGASVYDAYGAAAAQQANLNLAPGTYVNGDVCTYASSGTLLNCNTAVPGAYTLPSQYKTWSCEPGLGDGLNAITAGTYLQSTCWNKTGATVTLTGVGCFTDNAGSSTLNAAGNTLGALLTGAVTCTSSLASGTQSSNVLLTNGDYIKFTFVADGTSKQTTFVVTGSY